MGGKTAPSGNPGCLPVASGSLAVELVLDLADVYGLGGQLGGLALLLPLLPDQDGVHARLTVPGVLRQLFITRDAQRRRVKWRKKTSFKKVSIQQGITKKMKSVN